LSRYAGVKGRLQCKPAHAGATLIDDTYNANPESMQAAIDVLARAPGQRLLVLGDMGELGERAAACHAEAGEYARAAGIERLYALGELSAGTAAAFGAGARHFPRIEELLAEIENVLAPDVTVLVKGSRFMQMERVVKAFAVEQGVCTS
jgi:UDP-N-acetylmuramoyl-tripeptide--D-alanyl-D-alanine ligase